MVGDSPEATWSAAKAALISGNISSAVANFSRGSAKKYRQAFMSVSTEELASIVGKIPDQITVAVIENDDAQYWFDKIVGGVTVTVSIDFVKEHGIWKILEF
jgi:hypothetical protein